MENKKSIKAVREDCTSQHGKVTAVYPDRVVVSFIQSSACSGCHAASACTMLDHKRREVTVYTPQGLYNIGDEVIIKVENRAGVKAIVLSFVLPLFFLLIVAVLSVSVFHLTETIAIGLCILTLIVYYLILSFFTKSLRKKVTFSIEKYSNPQ